MKASTTGKEASTTGGSEGQSRFLYYLEGWNAGTAPPTASQNSFPSGQWFGVIRFRGLSLGVLLRERAGTRFLWLNRTESGMGRTRQDFQLPDREIAERTEKAEFLSPKRDGAN